MNTRNRRFFSPPRFLSFCTYHVFPPEREGGSVKSEMQATKNLWCEPPQIGSAAAAAAAAAAKDFCLWGFDF